MPDGKIVGSELFVVIRKPVSLTNVACVNYRYILYGTAKSGKSAVVKSILNIESYSRGAVAILNQNTRHSYGVVGYMPQSVGLDTSLTAIETVNYFAMLQKLNRHDCAKV